MADLQEHLVPTGFWSRYRESEYHSYRTSIALSTIQYATDLVELLPLPLLEHGCEQTPMRVRRVTIVSLALLMPWASFQSPFFQCWKTHRSCPAVISIPPDCEGMGAVTGEP